MDYDRSLNALLNVYQAQPILLDVDQLAMILLLAVLRFGLLVD
jgi:hypothetical protein